MCGCGGSGKAKTSVASKIGRRMVYILKKPDGTEHEFSTEEAAYAARKDGGKVRLKVK